MQGVVEHLVGPGSFLWKATSARTRRIEIRALVSSTGIGRLVCPEYEAERERECVCESEGDSR